MAEIRGQPYTFYTPLFLNGARVTNPLIAAGDFKVSIDGGAFVALDTTPSVQPGGGEQVQVDLSGDEMDGEALSVHWRDPDGTWQDGGVLILTSAQGVDDLISEADLLTQLATIPAAVWASATRTLSSAGVLAIWDALVADLDVVGSIGKLLGDNINATIGSRSSHSVADIWAAGSRTLTSFGTVVADVWAHASRTLSTGAITSDTFTAGAIGGTALAADTDVYTAKVWLLDDDEGARDRYVVVWYKNGAVVAAGSVTSPTLTVVAVADGADLVASTAMTQVSGEDAFKHDASTTARIVAGAAYIAVAAATIGGSARAWVQPVGRDSG